MNDQIKISLSLVVVAVVFLTLAAIFKANPGKPAPLPEIPLVDAQFLSTATPRASYADLLAAGADLSNFACLDCHEPGTPSPLKFNRAGAVILREEHTNITLHHGSHNRNNNCYNCHDELHRDRLSTRDGRTVGFLQSPRLCGSCHGPTYRDWEAGAHGRTSGFWNQDIGNPARKMCVSCHNPHSPKYQGRTPAPMPHPLRPLAKPASVPEGEH